MPRSRPKLPQHVKSYVFNKYLDPLSDQQLGNLRDRLGKGKEPANKHDRRAARVIVPDLNQADLDWVGADLRVQYHVQYHIVPC